MGADMESPRLPRRAGLPFLVCGIVFMATAIGSHQWAFLGIGLSLLVLGIVFGLDSRRGDRQ